MTAAYLKTLLVDGTDIRSLTGLVAVNHLDLYAPGTRRGSPLTVPGRQGQVGVSLPWDAYNFAVGITVGGGDEAAMTDNIRAIGTALEGTGGLVSLERRLPTGSSGAYQAMYAKGMFSGGLGFTLLNPVTGQTELQFANLSGAWTPTLADVDDPTATSWVVP